MLTGRDYYTPEEMESCLCNQAPGSTDYVVVALQGANHGRALGTLSASSSNKMQKVGLPAFDWPKITFPDVKQPLEEHAEYNKAQETKSLEQASDLFKTDNRIAAILVEPIMAEGGDRQASRDFYNSLRNLAQEHDIIFICDEVQTGCNATGKFYAHQWWNLDHNPDIIT